MEASQVDMGGYASQLVDVRRVPLADLRTSRDPRLGVMLRRAVPESLAGHQPERPSVAAFQSVI